MAQFGPSDWMQAATMIGYTRISDNSQDKADLKKSAAKSKPTLQKQFAYINKRLR